MSARADAAIMLAGFVAGILEARTTGRRTDTELLDDIADAYERYGRPGSADVRAPEPQNVPPAGGHQGAPVMPGGREAGETTAGGPQHPTGGEVACPACGAPALRHDDGRIYCSHMGVTYSADEIAQAVEVLAMTEAGAR